MSTYSPASLGINPPPGGFQQGGWYGGRQYWAGTLSEPGVIHPSSTQVGAGQAVSEEVNRQSAAAQGVPYPQFQQYLTEQAKRSATATPAPVAPAAAAGVSGAPAAVSTAGTAAAGTGVITPPEVLNLPRLYETLYSSSGIKDLEAQLSQREKDYTEAKGVINDNPFLSEASRVGRIAKLETLFQERTRNLRDDIARKKADIETQLNLQTKQFDINSTVAKQALDQFNTLLGMGALNNATGEDIANITRSTGISSSMIQGAIAANKAKNVKTEIKTFTADSGEVTAVIFDSNSGNVVSKQSLGMIGNKEGGGKTSTAQNIKAQFLGTAESLVNSGSSDIFPLLVQQYAPYYTLEEIYQLYLQSAPGQAYGTPKENPQEIKAIYDVYRGTLSPEEAAKKYGF